MSKDAGVIEVPFKLHPRVFQALGSELVTSDVVAVIELVKNSYDAFANRVDVRFGVDEDGAQYLEIEDDGGGMTKAIIDEVWCMVATPFRAEHPKAKKGNKVRRSTGAKGLGRLSAARLGESMRIITRTKVEGAWQLDVTWSDLAKAKNANACTVTRRPYKGNDFTKPEGTQIRVTDLKTDWAEDEVEDLNEALSRLTSPFEQVADFEIWFTPPGAEATASKIETEKFLKHPTYLMKGAFSSAGELTFKYTFKPIGGKGRSDNGEIEWAIMQKDINDSLKEKKVPLKKKPVCGPFDFELRVWDLDQESMAEAESKWEIKKSQIRRQIRAFKGLSLYRDGVLVLPKSDNNRDWLGLDLRRVSKVGNRLSTSQIVGYVSITADKNPGIDDTSDRERLARSEEVAEFERVLRDIVSRLEEERSRDQEEDEPKLRELFNDLSPRALVEQVEELAAQNGTLDEALPLLTSFSRSAEKAIEQVEKQFFYYSRLATIGTISEMLVHEVGNNCSALEAFAAYAKDWADGKTINQELLRKRMALAEQAIATLRRLAERFRPLAARNYKRGKRTAHLKETVDACIETFSEQLRNGKIRIESELHGPDELRIDPGELYPVLHNLIDNAIYWLHHVKDRERLIQIGAKREKEMVVCTVSDNGPGVTEKDLNRIFNAGVTRKPNGSGMGLTVAGELVESNEGKIFLESPGDLGGATFSFSLPFVS